MIPTSGCVAGFVTNPADALLVNLWLRCFAGMASSKAACALPLSGVYELSARPNKTKAADISQATWDGASCRAFVERPKKHLTVMGYWASCGSEGQPKQLALYPEEALLLVEQGLLLLRQPNGTRSLSVAEAQAMTLSHAQLCPLFFEVYAHLRELGLVALRLTLLGPLRAPVECIGAGEYEFRGRPLLALWSAERAARRGWRQSHPDHILATSDASDAMPSEGEWARLEDIAARAGASLKLAVTDETGSPIFFDCSRSLHNSRLHFSRTRARAILLLADSMSSFSSALRRRILGSLRFGLLHRRAKGWPRKRCRTMMPWTVENGRPYQTPTPVLQVRRVLVQGPMCTASKSRYRHRATRCVL